MKLAQYITYLHPRILRISKFPLFLFLSSHLQPSGASIFVTDRVPPTAPVAAVFFNCVDPIAGASNSTCLTTAEPADDDEERVNLL